MAPIGEQIQNARKAKGMTQDALAKAINVTRQTISNYESGKRLPDVSTLIRISQVLDYNLMDQVSESELPTEEEAAQADMKDTEAGSGEVEAAESAEASQTENEPADPQRIVADPDSKSTEPTPESEPVSTPARTAGRRRLIFLIASIAILLAVALLVWKPWQGSGSDSYQDEDGTVYTISEFKQTTQNDASKGYLRMVPSFQLMKTEASDYWLFTLNCYETNHIALSVDRYEEFLFGDKKLIHRTFGSNDLEPIGLSPSIDADGEWMVTGGFPVQAAMKGVGWKITATDANNETETFISYLPLPEN